jgi:hypothetical protein
MVPIVGPAPYNRWGGSRGERNAGQHASDRNRPVRTRTPWWCGSWDWPSRVSLGEPIGGSCRNSVQTPQPSATSRIIITEKPAMVAMVTISMCLSFLWDSGISCSTTTNIIAPAAKHSA